MEKLHTPEPWDQGLYDNPKRLALAIFDERHDEVAVSDTVETARRIVACVNACAGIETERLEKNASDPIAGLFGRMASRLTTENKKLTAQRDDLLAALRALYGWTKAEVEHFGATCPDDFIIEMVEKALKNA